jgi:uncharacterized protein YkwD
MGRRLSYILLSIVLFSLFSTHTSAAASSQNQDTFFSFITNYILAFTDSKNDNNQVLGANTSAKILPTPNPTAPPQVPTIPPSEQNPPLSDVSSYILNGVNAYRASLGLSPVQASTETCAFATIRAQEITSNFSHDAFYARVNNHTIPYSQWAHATENIAEAPDYKEVVTLWKNSPPHAANMRDNTPYVCIVQNGNYFAYEGMRP